MKAHKQAIDEVIVYSFDGDGDVRQPHFISVKAFDRTAQRDVTDEVFPDGKPSISRELDVYRFATSPLQNLTARHLYEIKARLGYLLGEGEYKKTSLTFQVRGVKN